MKYYLVAGEASGDLHASHLMSEIKKNDSEAEFRFFGGDLMAAQGGTLVKHYRQMAFMGFIAVIKNLRTVLRNMRDCKRDIKEYAPDAVILVDYPGFNLKIAKYVKTELGIPTHYYIAPKIWAWKEYRIKEIKQYVDYMYSILPFEVDYFNGLGYKVDYVGNPTVDELAKRENADETFSQFTTANNLNTKPIIALIAGSRVGEIKGSLPRMIEAVEGMDEYQFVVAGAPSISPELYEEIIGDKPVKVVYGKTYRLMQQATAALVTSGTATLETALMGVPQVVCYHVAGGKFTYKLFEKILKVKFVSLVNLIAGKEVVKELLACYFTPENTRMELSKTLQPSCREKILEGYQLMRNRLGAVGAPRHAAKVIVKRVANG
ncbi:MAG: lipid-A-disaccharide synthase [Muribaculaceae bacterium]|nr:lipid-A-disaccharide synthase [Muribaculaceae bacterium]